MKTTPLAEILGTVLGTTAFFGLVPERPPIKKIALATVLGTVLGTTAYFGLVPVRSQTQWMTSTAIPDDAPVPCDSDVINFR
jgi:hypothetical protein